MELISRSYLVFQSLRFLDRGLLLTKNMISTVFEAKMKSFLTVYRSHHDFVNQNGISVSWLTTFFLNCKITY